MSRYFEAVKSTYKHPDEFKHGAMHTLNKLYPQRAFDCVDFGERIGTKPGEEGVVFYTATAYYPGEKIPPEAAEGAPLTAEHIAAQDKARQEQEARDDAAMLKAKSKSKK